MGQIPQDGENEQNMAALRARIPDELERNQKQENHPTTISKMMDSPLDTLVQVQLFTFSYWWVLFRPQKLSKI